MMNCSQLAIWHEAAFIYNELEQKLKPLRDARRTLESDERALASPSLIWQNRKDYENDVKNSRIMVQREETNLIPPEKEILKRQELLKTWISLGNQR